MGRERYVTELKTAAKGTRLLLANFENLAPIVKVFLTVNGFVVGKVNKLKSNDAFFNVLRCHYDTQFIFFWISSVKQSFITPD